MRRAPAVLLAAGCAPFALGRLDGGGDGLLEAVPCPLRAVTGVPCPFCGASRAFALAARGDLAVLARPGAPWVLVALLALVAGAALLARPAPGLPGGARGAGAAAALTVAGAWGWALALGT